MVAASLSLLLLFAFPLWKITLEAAQFPGGLYMYIWINKISGSSEHILQNINILNHYIGMKPIHPDSIPELKYFPYIVGALSATGLLVALADRKWLYFSWFIILVVLGALGIYDFYLWEYDYGHNLDPKAPIKIPGMAFQPPLIGRKELLNFVAHSYPALGSLFLFLSGVASFLAFYLKKGKKRKAAAGAAGMILLSFLFTACSPEPKPIQFGEDQCVYCKMTIVDQKYGAELVNDKGKVFPFDATECMVNYLRESPKQEKDHAYVLAVAFDTPKKLHPVDELTFLISPQLPSPMGANLSAFKSRERADAAQEEYSGALLDWEEVKNQLANN